jgi:hypothetical protein
MFTVYSIDDAEWQWRVQCVLPSLDSFIQIDNWLVANMGQVDGRWKSVNNGWYFKSYDDAIQLTLTWF